MNASSLNYHVDRLLERVEMLGVPVIPVRRIRDRRDNGGRTEHWAEFYDRDGRLAGMYVDKSGPTLLLDRARTPQTDALWAAAGRCKIKYRNLNQHWGGQGSS